jgi:hypothetical protein
MSLPCTYLFADLDGESHFGEIRIALSALAFAPPAPPVDVSTITDARCGLLRLPSGWFGDWHPAPRRQLMCLLSGTVEVAASDSEVRRLEAGTIVLLEDTSGVGHSTRVISAEPAIMMFAQTESGPSLDRPAENGG